MKENKLAIVVSYEIYKQDLREPYIALELVGRVNTIDEARNCCKLLREAIETASARGLTDERRTTNFIFRPVIKESI